MERNSETDRDLEIYLAALGSFCWRRPWLVLFAWLLIMITVSAAIPHMSGRLQSGSGQIEGSMSQKVDTLLVEEFGISDGQSLILTLNSRLLFEDTDQLTSLIDTLDTTLSELEMVEKVISASDIFDVPADTDTAALVIRLAAKSTLVAEQQVPQIRDAIWSVLQASLLDVPDLDWAVTGRAALNHDISIFSIEDTASSEFRALPLALLVLLYAFGAPLSSAIPLVLAAAARTLALAAVLLVAGYWSISNLAQSIVTMLSLALGIDYSLFIYHRYRQLLQAPDDICIDQPSFGVREEALCSAMRQSGVVVLYSGTTVAIAMGALLLTPLMQTQSIGIGGLTAVVFSLLAALTLLPALLSLISPRALDWPNWSLRRKPRPIADRFWTSWGRTITRHPLASIVASLLLLGALAAPAMETRFGIPEEEFLPADLESARGLKMLEKMGLKGLVSPIFVVISDTAHQPILTDERRRLFSDLLADLYADPRVREVFAPNLSGFSLPFPLPSNMSLVNTDKDRIVIQIVPAGDIDLASVRELAQDVPGWLDDPSLTVEVGGQAQYYNDFDTGMLAAYPRIIILVLSLTGLALLLMLRAPVAAAKAIFLNLFSVAAGYGSVIFVFQLGYGAALFGLEAPTGVVPTSVPVIIFSILFGISMDYEIFLISKIKSLYLESGDNLKSIVEALSDTGSVITSAALIMVVVFGAFAFSRIVIVQMVGLGLAVAILVDAMIIRTLLGPALMVIAGRWNWWPLKPKSTGSGQ